jgi:hypothetical protein
MLATMLHAEAAVSGSLEVLLGIRLMYDDPL